MDGPQEPWGPSPWRIEARVPAAPLPEGCDVAVVGAGLTGLAAALDLAERGARVAVLEAARVGAGASGRTGGLALEGTHLGDLPGGESCLATLRDLAFRHRIDCGLVLPGCAELVHGDAQKRAGSFLGWSDEGRPLDVAARVAGGLVDPGRLVAGLARAALAAGATLHENVSVGRLRAAGEGLLLETARGTIAAGAVVVALNAFTGTLLASPEPPVAALSFALRTAPLASGQQGRLALPEAFAFYTVDLPYLWGRSCGDGSLLIGSGLTPAPPGGLHELDVARGEPRERLADLERRVRELHPALADVAVRERWGGPVALLREQPPRLELHPELPGVVVTGGYTGHGVAASVHFGTRAARLLH